MCSTYTELTRECVSAVLLMGDEVAASAATISSAAVTRSWLLLAWVSTVAGNLSLLGSAANLIVCEQARRVSRNAHDLTFWSHVVFGAPSTLVVTAEIGRASCRERV